MPLVRSRNPGYLRVLPLEEEDIRDCGILSFRPRCIQRFANIQAFVFLSCVLVTLQQALSSGYFNSVITTIEKRFDIPSRVSGGIASTFELGNLLTIIFVSYLGTHRHIPIWIGKGIIVMGVGSMVFALPYLIDTVYTRLGGDHRNSSLRHYLDENTCYVPPIPAAGELQFPSRHTGKISISISWLVERHILNGTGTCDRHFMNSPALEADPTACNEGTSSNVLYILLFMLAQVLIGCGGSPIFTLGTTYIDDHVKKDSSSMYIGCIYSMVAFGLVCGFLLGGYLLSIHEDAMFQSIPHMTGIYPGHPRWVGAWWLGFVIFGILLLLVSIPYFAFPKYLRHDREKVLWEEKRDYGGGTTSTAVCRHTHQRSASEDYHHHNHHHHGSSSIDQAKKQIQYGKDIKDIPLSMWRLLTNPIYMLTCLGSALELSIVSGFVIFLPKYLETQFSIGKSQANIFTGGIAIPGACIGIFMGGYLLKKFQLTPKGAIQFVMFFNIICMGLYTLLYFLGCDNIKMAGATLPYYNNTGFDTTFQVNLTADCNMGCRCSPNDLEPVCGRNGITYFSPCHAGCQRTEDANNPMVQYLVNPLSRMYHYFIHPNMFSIVYLQLFSNWLSPFSRKMNLLLSFLIPLCKDYTNSMSSWNGRMCSLMYYCTPTKGCCSNSSVNQVQNYWNCACIMANGTHHPRGIAADVRAVPLATTGPCPNMCSAILPFMVLLFIMTLVVSITQMPLLMITLRSVNQEERAFALGMQFVIFRLFGYIPSPILFGNVIDSTCILWKAHCGRPGGFCLMYNIEHFRIKYIGVSSGLKVAAALLFFLDWLLISYRHKKDGGGALTMGELVTSIISLDRLSTLGWTEANAPLDPDGGDLEDPEDLKS
ncbi:SLCO5A1 [Cordylochernes scorpioides]|uniref:Solute carrier organic anion transporter family member n=1 Tax=Cordylochernes scorpioides TaxID=51811 RepID=A0ABY6K132_9ARAC|nr:SLCO5A1 [Cordylochernes scorpioides]